jgi:hypothetical protein
MRWPCTRTGTADRRTVIVDLSRSTSRQRDVRVPEAVRRDVREILAQILAAPGHRVPEGLGEVFWAQVPAVGGARR